MFNFTDHINPKERTKTEKYAMIISLYDRLEAYGLLPTLYANKKSGEPIVIESIGRFINSNGFTPSNSEMENYSVLPRKNVFNAASWDGVERDNLVECIKNAHEEISNAIDSSILEYLSNSPKLPSLQLEGRLFAAQKDGFDIHSLHYHETEKENKKSIILNGFDINNVGARSGDGTLPDGVFFKPNKNTVELAAEPVQMAFLLRKNKVLSFKTRDEFKDYTNQIKGVLELEEKIHDVDSRYKQSFDKTLDNFTLSEEPKKTKIGLELNELLVNWKSEVRELCAQSRKLITAHLKSEGVTTLNVESDPGSFGRVVNSTIALNPDDVLYANINSLPKITLEHLHEKPVVNKRDAEEYTVEPPVYSPSLKYKP